MPVSIITKSFLVNSTAQRIYRHRLSQQKRKFAIIRKSWNKRKNSNNKIDQRKKNDPFGNDFEKIIKKQMQLQGLTYEQQPKGFDYLTNPGKIKDEELEPQPQPDPPTQEPVIIKEQKKFDLTQKIQKLQRHYQNSLKKKFERRQMFPHYACKRKTPKLYITTKTNTLQKYGKKPPQQEHAFRIMTKQCTPQQIYPTIPNFAIVKDNLSKNVMAYLGDYKPFIDKTKEEQNSEQNSQNNQKQLNNEGQGWNRQMQGKQNSVNP